MLSSQSGLNRNFFAKLHNCTLTTLQLYLISEFLVSKRKLKTAKQITKFYWFKYTNLRWKNDEKLPYCTILQGRNRSLCVVYKFFKKKELFTWWSILSMKISSLIRLIQSNNDWSWNILVKDDGILFLLR